MHCFSRDIEYQHADTCSLHVLVTRCHGNVKPRPVVLEDVKQPIELHRHIHDWPVNGDAHAARRKKALACVTSSELRVYLSKTEDLHTVLTLPVRTRFGLIS